MIPRTVSTVFASILLVIQLVSAPFTHAMGMPSGADACCDTPVVHGAPAAGHDVDAGCERMTSDPSHHCKHPGQQHRSHASCSCPCSHTPALAGVRPLVLVPTPPVDSTGALAAATFGPPLFKLLRPPK